MTRRRGHDAPSFLESRLNEIGNFSLGDAEASFQEKIPAWRDIRAKLGECYVHWSQIDQLNTFGYHLAEQYAHARMDELYKMMRFVSSPQDDRNFLGPKQALSFMTAAETDLEHASMLVEEGREREDNAQYEDILRYERELQNGESVDWYVSKYGGNPEDVIARRFVSEIAQEN
jgi:hypothetical protein